MSTTATPAAAPAFAIGQTVTFNGYAQALPEGMSPIFTQGQDVILLAPGDDPGSFKAGLSTDQSIQDTVFPEEILAKVATAAPAARRAAPAKPVAAVAPVAAAAAPVAPKAAAAKPAAKAAAPKPATAAPAAAPAAKPAAAKPAAAAAKKAAPVAAAPAAAAPATAPAKPAGRKAAAPAAKPLEQQVEPPAVETPAPVEPPVPEVIPETEAVTAAVAESGDILTAAKTVAADVQEKFITLGGILSQIYRGNLHLGYQNEAGEQVYAGNMGFAAYCQNELNVAYRSAMGYIDVYETFAKLGIEHSRLASVGIGKAIELARAATAENFEELLTFAGEHNREELQAHIKETKVGNTDGTGRQRQQRSTSNKVGFKFTLFDDQAATAKQALESAKARGDKEDENAAFSTILTEWLLMQEGAEVPLEVALQNVATRYGVSVGVVEDQPAAEVEQEAAAE